MAQKKASIDSLEQLLHVAKTPLSKAKLYDQLAEIYLFQDINKALDYTANSLLLISKDELGALADFHNTSGLVLSQFGEEEKHEKGLLHFDTSLALYTQLNDQRGILKVHSNQGGLYNSSFKYDLALNSFQKGLSLAEELKDTSAITKNLSGIAGVYLAQRKIHKSLEYINKAYVWEKSLGEKKDNLALSGYAINIGHIYSNIEEYDSSLHYFNLALFYAEGEYVSIIAIAYEKIGHTYQQQEKLDSAILYANKALDLAGTTNNEKIKFRALTLLAKIYFQAENYKQSILYAQENLAATIKTGDYYLQANNLEILIKNHLALEDFKTAFTQQSKLIEVEKLFLDEEQQEHIDELEIKYESYKKEQENKLLAKERDVEKLKAERNEQVIYAVFLILLLVILIIYGLYQRTKITGRERATQLKHQLLRNQMNPHFIFNALIAIQSFVYSNEPRETDKYLSSFAKLIRGILENSTKEYITLERELKWLKNYLELQLLRFDYKFTYEIAIDSEIDIYNTLIPPMLTQPFIENALEHGLKNIDYKGVVHVNFKVEGGDLKVTIQDNGAGIDLANSIETKKQHISLATKITKERILFLNKKATSKIYFEIKPIKPLGTIVSFKIPLKYT